MDVVEIVELIDTGEVADGPGDFDGGDPTQAIDLVILTEIDDAPDAVDERPVDDSGEPLFPFADDGDPTPVGSGFSEVAQSTADDGADDDFRFSFDDTDDPDRPRS